MDPILNPYNPGAGLRPFALVGRDQEIELVDAIIQRAAHGMTSRGIILHGLRGVGKTVLLNELARRAEQADWLTVQFEASLDPARGKQVRNRLARELVQGARKLSASERWQYIADALPVISAFSAKLGFTGVTFDVQMAKGRGDSGDLSLDLEELVLDVASVAQRNKKGIAFFIDEMQDLDTEMLSALISAQHQAGQKGLPFYVIGAGLPTLPGILADTQSYAERLFTYRNIGKLALKDALAALRDPAASQGCAFEEGAAERLANAAAGYPYFLQEYGSAMWEIAPASPFTREDIALAVAQGNDSLDQGFFPSRWERATPAEKKFMAGMAEVGKENIPIAEVAQELHSEVRSLGNVRKQLIQKGLIYSAAHGQVRFTVPGMANFIFRHREDSLEQE